MSEHPTLRQRKKQDKRDRIMASARALFAERGFDRTTTRAISERAGIGTGTLFTYFPDKTTLLVQLFVAEIEAAANAGFDAAQAERDLNDQLRVIFGHLYDYYGDNPALSRVVVKEVLFIQAEHRVLGASNLNFVSRLASLVEAARAKGRLPADTAPMLVATACFAQYFMVLTTWLSGAIASRDSADLLLRQLLDLIIPPRRL